MKKLLSEDDMFELEKKLIPDSGQCDTVEGEMLRAVQRLEYRYYNDGDIFWRGYGKETALPSALTALFNPEYWALQEILDRLK